MAGFSFSTSSSSSPNPSSSSSTSSMLFSNFFRPPSSPQSFSLGSTCALSSNLFAVSSSSTPTSTLSSPSLFSTIITTTPTPAHPTLTSPAFGLTSSTPAGISASTTAAATPPNGSSAAQNLSSQVVASNSGVTTNVGKVVGFEQELPSETPGKTVEEVTPPPFPQEVGFVSMRTEAYRIPLLPPPPELLDFLNSHEKDEMVTVKFGVLQDMYRTFSSWEGLLSFILSRSSDTRTLLSTYDRMAEASGVQLTSCTGTGTGPWAVARSRVSSGTRPSNS